MKGRYKKGQKYPEDEEKREQLMDKLEETTGYWKLKEEALDCTLWRTGCGMNGYKYGVNWCKYGVNGYKYGMNGYKYGVNWCKYGMNGYK